MSTPTLNTKKQNKPLRKSRLQHPASSVVQDTESIIPTTLLKTQDHYKILKHVQDVHVNFQDSPESYPQIHPEVFSIEL